MKYQQVCTIGISEMQSSFKWFQWFTFAPEAQLLYFWQCWCGMSQKLFSLACLCCCPLMCVSNRNYSVPCFCSLIPAWCFSRNAGKHVKSAAEPRYVQAGRVQASFLPVSSERSGRLGVLTNYRCHEDSNVCDWKDHVISYVSVCQSRFTAVLLPCDPLGQSFLCVTCAGFHFTPMGYLGLVNNYCCWWDLAHALVSSIVKHISLQGFHALNISWLF